METEVNSMNKLLDFGSMSIKMLTELFFWIGSVPILVNSILLGYIIALSTTWDRMVQTGDSVWTGVESNNYPLGIFSGILAFILCVLLWRLICEVIYIILNFFKSNLKNNT